MLQISELFTLCVRILKQSALSLLTYCPDCQGTAFYIFRKIQYQRISFYVHFPLTVNTLRYIDITKQQNLLQPFNYYHLFS